MKSDVWFDVENGIARMKLVGKVSSEEYARVNRKMIETIPAEKRKKQLIDLSASEQIKLDRETRKKISEEMRDSEVPGTKSAILGASPAIRMLTKIMLAMQKGTDTETRFFDTEEQAINWLKKSEGK